MKNIVLASTVIRNTPDKELTGLLYKINWDYNEIEKAVPIPVGSEIPFWNERGGNRGGRGISVYDNKIHLATARAILVFDFNLNIIDEIHQNLFAGLHEIVCTHKGIWVTSTIHDLLLMVDYKGQILYEWWGSESKEIQKQLGYKSRNLNKDAMLDDDFLNNYESYVKEERLHLNAVAEFNNGLFVLASRKNALIQVFPKPERVIFVDKNLGAPHNCLFMQNGTVLMNNTKKQKLNIYNVNDGNLLESIDTTIYTNCSKSEQFVTGGWQRGLARLSQHKVIVGTSPATVFSVDTQFGVVEKILKVDDDEKNCVHGLCVTQM